MSTGSLPSIPEVSGRERMKELTLDVPSGNTFGPLSPRSGQRSPFATLPPTEGGSILSSHPPVTTSSTVSGESKDIVPDVLTRPDPLPNFTTESLSSGLRRFQEATQPKSAVENVKKTRGRRQRSMTTMEPQRPRIDNSARATGFTREQAPHPRVFKGIGTTGLVRMTEDPAVSRPAMGVRTEHSRRQSRDDSHVGIRTPTTRRRGHTRVASAVPAAFMSQGHRRTTSRSMLSREGGALPAPPANMSTRRRLRAASVGPGASRRPDHLSSGKHRSHLNSTTTIDDITKAALDKIEEGSDEGEVHEVELPEGATFEDDHSSDLSDSDSMPRQSLTRDNASKEEEEAILAERKWYFDRKSKEQKQKLEVIKNRITKLLFKYEFEGAKKDGAADADVMNEDQDYSTLTVEDQFFQMYVSKFKTESLFKNLARIEQSRNSVLTLMKQWMGEDHLHEVDLEPAVHSDEESGSDIDSPKGPVGRPAAMSLPGAYLPTGGRRMTASSSVGTRLSEPSTPAKAGEGAASSDDPLPSPRKMKPNHHSLTRVVADDIDPQRRRMRHMKHNLSAISDLSHISEDNESEDDRVVLNKNTFDKILDHYRNKVSKGTSQLQEIMFETTQEYKNTMKGMNPTSSGHLLAKNHREMTELRNELKSQILEHEQTRIELRNTKMKLAVSEENLEEAQTELKNAQHRFHLSAVRAVERQGELRKKAMELKQGAEGQLEEKQRLLSEAEAEIQRLKGQIKKMGPMTRQFSTSTNLLNRSRGQTVSHASLPRGGGDGSDGRASQASDRSGEGENWLGAVRTEALEVQSFSLSEKHILEFPVDHDIPFLRKMYDNNRKILNNYLALKQMEDNRSTLESEKAYLKAGKEAQAKVKKMEQEMFQKLSAANDELAQVKKASTSKYQELVKETYAEQQALNARINVLNSELNQAKSQLVLLKEDPALVRFYELRQKKKTLEENIDAKQTEYSRVAGDLSLSAPQQRQLMQTLQIEIDERIAMAEKLETQILGAASSPAARELAEALLEAERLERQLRTERMERVSLQNSLDREQIAKAQLADEVAALRESLERKGKAKKNLKKAMSGVAASKAVKAFKGLLGRTKSKASDIDASASKESLPAVESEEDKKKREAEEKARKEAEDIEMQKKAIDEKFSLAPIPQGLAGQIEVMKSGYVPGWRDSMSSLKKPSEAEIDAELRRMSDDLQSVTSHASGTDIGGGRRRSMMTDAIIRSTRADVGTDANQFDAARESRASSPITEEQLIELEGGDGTMIAPSFLQRADAKIHGADKFAVKSKEDKELEDRQRRFELEKELADYKEMVAMQVNDLHLIKEIQSLKKENTGLRKAHATLNEELVTVKEDNAKYARKLVDSGDEYGKLLREHSAFVEKMSEASEKDTSSNRGRDVQHLSSSEPGPIRPTTAPAPNMDLGTGGPGDGTGGGGSGHVVGLGGDSDIVSRDTSTTSVTAVIKRPSTAGVLGEDADTEVTGAGGSPIRTPRPPAVVSVSSKPPRQRRKVDASIQTGRLVSATQHAGVQTRAQGPPQMGKFVSESSKLAQERANEIRKLTGVLKQTQDLLASMYAEKKMLEQALQQTELGHELALLDAEKTRGKLLHVQHRLLKHKERIKDLLAERRRYQVNPKEKSAPSLIIGTGSKEVYVADNELSIPEAHKRDMRVTADAGAQTIRSGELDKVIVSDLERAEILDYIGAPTLRDEWNSDSPSNRDGGGRRGGKKGEPTSTTYRITSQGPSYVETATQCTILTGRAGAPRGSSHRSTRSLDQRPGTTGKIGYGGLTHTPSSPAISHSGSAVWRRLVNQDKGKGSDSNLQRTHGATLVTRTESGSVVESVQSLEAVSTGT